MSFPYHKPVAWELFRNEALESQNRQAAITKSRDSAWRDEKESPLWWDAQKYVDQVVPAEFICPKDVDTCTYRYQVFARPPPIPCPPRSLREVTDACPPIRYNVKRVAVDKPFPLPGYECPDHWAKHQFVHKKNCGTEEAGQDASRNNNTRPSPLGPAELGGRTRAPAEPRVSQSHNNKNYPIRKERCLDQNVNKAQLSGKSQERRGMIAAPGTERRCESKTLLCRDVNNSQTCLSHVSDTECYQQENTRASVLPSKPCSQRDAAKGNRAVTGGSEIKPDVHNGSPKGQGRLHRSPMLKNCSLLSARADQSHGNTGSRSHTDLSRDRNSHSQRVCHTPRAQTSCRSSRSQLSNCSVASTNYTRQGNRCENVCLQSTPNMRECTVNPTVSRASSPASPKNLAKPPCSSPVGLGSLRMPQISNSVSSFGSRPCSARSASTISSCHSVQRKVSAVRCAELDQGEPLRSASSLRRESVASLLSAGGAPPPPALTVSVNKGRRQFPASKNVSCQESVASLLGNSKHNSSSSSNKNINNNDNNNNNSNNQCGAADVLLASVALQDVFADSTPDAFTQNGPTFVDHTWSFTEPFGEEESPALRAAKGKALPLCTNNNASGAPHTKPGTYILECCPVNSCGAQSQASCEPEAEKMLCRFHGKRPQIAENAPVTLDQVVPVDPSSWKVTGTDDPKEFQCTTLRDCLTGKSLESAKGPLMVCETKRPTTPKIGYGTYKIVGSVQRREAPVPNQLHDVRLPPDLEEYREFTRRCPNFQTGRYDRSDPLNEMLLPANKSSVLLGSNKLGPHTYSRLQKRKLPALFKPQQTSSDLNWSLPAAFVNQ